MKFSVGRLMGILVAVVAANALAASLTVGSYAQPFEEGGCELVRQLQNLEPGLEYMGRIKAAKQAASSPYGEQNLFTVAYRDNNGSQIEIDAFSYECLTCHDGVNTRVHAIRYKNNSRERSGEAFQDHPIGMHYGSYAYSSREFRRLYELKEEMVLVDGKVGCLTCHNPFNPEKKHLSSSNLCLGCHVK